MSESSERDDRHKARMQRKKALIDEKIAEAQDEYGLLLVHTGNGKGKIFKHGEVIRTVPEGEIVQFLVQEANRMADEMDTTGAVEVTVS